MTKKKITSKEVKKISSLARIKLTDKEEDKFSKELGSILDFFDDICRVNTSDIKKIDHYKLNKNQVRKDEIKESSNEEKKEIKENFPERRDDYLSVKVVLK